MKGHLDLVCGVDAVGHSHLRRQSFRAPMHISKPHLDEETLVVNVVNPTAGYFEGDEVECRVHVETGARLLLTSPSASRAHCVAGTGEARLNQHFSVESGGWLEIWPELFIPQGGTRYRQHTRVDLAEGAGLLFFETLAPGRVASGEAFKFQSLDWETGVFYDGTHVVREKYQLTPDNMTALRKQFATAYYACVFLFHPMLTPQSDCWESVDGLQNDSVWVGHSRLQNAGWCIKLLAAESVVFRKSLKTLRDLCYLAMKERQPSIRRQ